MQDGAGRYVMGRAAGRGNPERKAGRETPEEEARENTLGGALIVADRASWMR